MKWVWAKVWFFSLGVSFASMYFQPDLASPLDNTSYPSSRYSLPSTDGCVVPGMRSKTRLVAALRSLDFQPSGKL
jgi:hypothetical protein